MNPSFTIVIPTFNRLSLLKDAVHSVLNQTYQHFELIVIDDASEDETVHWLECLLSEKLTIIQNRTNRGVSSCRNTGIHMARGHFIAFLDSDDIWEKTKLEKQARFFSENPDINVCHTNEKWVRNGKHLNQKSVHQKVGGFFFERATHLCLVSPSTVAIRRSIFATFGLFDEQLPVCEDHDLWLRINAKQPFGYLDEVLITKRGGHDDQLSQTPLMDKYRLISLRNLLTHEKLTTEQEQHVRDTIALKLMILRKGAIKHQNNDIITFCDEFASHF